MNKTSIILASILAAILIIGAFVGGFFAGKGKRPDVQRDTVTTVVTIRDTLTVYEPKEVTKTVIRKEYIAVTDTVVVNDTTYISLPVERKEYRDSNYYAVVSGINPSLEEISVYPETKIITQTITVTDPAKKGRFSIGAQAGWYVIYDAAHKQVATGPGAGAGLSFGWTF